MATGQGNSQAGSGGYPKEIFKDGRGLEPKYLCNSCHLVLRDPVQAFCGHRFCKQCLEDKIRCEGQMQCEQCLSEDHEAEAGEDLSIITMDQIFPDNAIKREMSKLRIVCINPGCSWHGVFKEYEEHNAVCEFKSVKCPACGKIVRENALSNHQNSECFSLCELCNNRVLTKDMKDHVEMACPKAVIVCGQCGKQGVLRESMATHQGSSECQSNPVACPVGCGVIERNEYQNHFRTFHHEIWVVQEMHTLIQKIQQLNQIGDGVSTLYNQLGERNAQVDHRLEVFDRQLQELASRPGSSEAAGGTSGVAERLDMTVNQAVESRFQSLMQSMQALGTQTSTFEGIATTMHREVDKLQGKVNGMAAAIEQNQVKILEMSSTIDQNQTKIRSLERSVALKDITIAELELKMQCMESASFDGSLLWKITDFREKHQAAVSGRTMSIYSPPFYTSKRGYKMCARLYPNGDGMGKGTHLSLFFVVMKGNFDALLKWPYGQKVTMCLINQNGSEHVVDSFRPDPQSTSFKRPTSDMNIASGCPLFIRQEILQNTNSGFVKDDVMFIKIAVDTTGLTDPIATFEDRVKPQS